MDKVWSWLAVELGKHAVWVVVGGVLLTVGLGFGISKLEFATGQDAYLNTSDVIYKDNVAYQNLFGGSTMLTVVTMDKGHTVAELFNPKGRAEFKTFHDSLEEVPALPGDRDSPDRARLHPQPDPGAGR